MYQIKRSGKEIEDVLDAAAEGEESGTKWPGMSYEQGVLAALRWVFGESDDNPMAD